MDIEQYQQQIVELVQEATGALYTGKIEVRFDEPDLWSLFLYLDRELVPLILSYQGDFEQFKKLKPYGRYKTRKKRREKR